MRKSLTKYATLATSALTLGSSLSQVALATVSAQEETALPEFSTVVQNDDEVIEGGTLYYALVGDPFAGVLNNMYYTAGPDGSIIELFNEGLYGYNENFEVDNSGFADIEFDQENKQVTITIPEGTQWDDGEPLTIDDVIFPYYVVGHPDYTGIRYGEDFQNVVGMEEYHNGEAEEISGLERVDDYTLVVTYIDFNNSMLQAGGGVSSYVEPEHLLGDIPVAELEDNEYVRTNPVGFGPFRVTNITPGEAVTYEANEYYYRGKPLIDEVVLEVVNATSAVAEMRAGNYDLAALPADQYDTFADATNMQVLGQLQNTMTYIGFKLGTFDAENGTNVMDDSRVTNNKALRQAMAYAIDNDAVGTEFYSGLRTRANTHITPNFADYHADDIEGYPFNPEMAVQLLNEAGFVDNDGDGFVEDPNGEPFTLGFASMSGGETAEPLAQYYLQSWQAIGVNVELVDGQLMEMNSFYERVQADDPAIDVFQAAFGTGGDPNPSGLYGRDAQFNYSRFVTEEHDALLAAISSEDAFDAEVRQQAFHDWQAYMIDEVPTIPTLYRYSLMAVNNRVKGYDMAIGTDVNWTEIGLTAEQPFAE
ncbi:oligopeptide ABC transporter substrate-binding protein [Fundicoccus sp. Sow4_H7]|uniref:oligopeptide ABC transporter substrate-binding protein n=1 Tax=Fundicoccus sp. Sow4_H7 TaxID=3438784 RepID=UPI003F920052